MRLWTARKPANATAPTTRAMTTDGVNAVADLDQAEGGRSHETVMSTAPRRSGLGAPTPSDVSGMWRMAMKMVAAAIGRLMKNTGRQETESTASPRRRVRRRGGGPHPDPPPTARARSSDGTTPR